MGLGHNHSLNSPLLAAPMGIIIACVVMQMIVGVKFPWLPRPLLNHSVNLQLAQRISERGIVWLKRMERFSRPRLSILCTSWPGRMLIGMVILIGSIAMIVPVSGTIPTAIGILVTGIGLLEEDGVVCLVGMSICLVASLIAAMLFFAIGLGGFSLFQLLRR